MAVGVIIGSAFGKIVTSFVNDLIMPPLGWIIGGVNFKDLKIELPANALQKDGEPVIIAYGNFFADLFRLSHYCPLHFLVATIIHATVQKKAGRGNTCCKIARTFRRSKITTRNTRYAAKKVNCQTLAVSPNYLTKQRIVSILFYKQ